MEPASVYSFSRSKYISESWSSSTTATLVSCGVDETYNSFAMDLLRFLPAGKKMREGPEKRSGSRRLWRGLTGFVCPEIQSDLMQEIQFGCGEKTLPANICNLPMTCLKNLCTFALRVCGHTAFPEQLHSWCACLGTFRGAVPCPAMLSEYSPASLQSAGALSFNVRA